MAAQRRITEEQRALIAQLVHVEHRPHRDVIELCARGIYGIEPFAVSKASVTEIAREQRVNGGLDLGEAGLAEIFDRLARDALTIGHRELERLKATQGKLDADHFLKIARSLRELQPMVKPNHTGNQAERDTFLGGIHGQQAQDSTTTNEDDESDSPLVTPNESDPPIDEALPLAA